MSARSTSTNRRPPAPRDAREHARAIAEAVDTAWHNQHGGSDIHIPISVVAGLALVSQGPGEADPTGRALLLDTAGFAQLLRDIWLRFTVARPDLNPRTQPLWRWLLDEEPDPATLRAAHAAGRAALWHGQLDLTGVTERRQEIDLLAPLLQQMRARSARDGLGQFLTPLDVTHLLGRMVSADQAAQPVPPGAPDDEPVDGQRICDPCAGTGTMLLGMAMALREHGRDPAAQVWYANDLDWLAAACLAVNTHLWGLGTRVLVGCGDGLLTDWVAEAGRQRRQALDEMASAWRAARVIAGVRRLMYDPVWEPVVGAPPRPADIDPGGAGPGGTPGAAVGVAGVAGADPGAVQADPVDRLAERLGLLPAAPGPRRSQLRLF